MFNIENNDFSAILTSNFEVLEATYGTDLAQAQLYFEHKAYVEGEMRFRKELQRALDNGSLADNVAAKPLVDTFVLNVLSGIKQWREDLAKTEEETKASGGRYRRTVAQIKLEDVPDDVLAVLTVKFAINAIAKTGGETVYPLQKLSRHLGQSVEDELRFGRIRDQEAQHYKAFIEKNLAKRVGVLYKRAYMSAVEQSMIAENQLAGTWDIWSPEDLVKVGICLIEILVKSTGRFSLAHRNEGTKDEYTVLVLDEEAQNHIASRASQLGGISPVYQPCVVPPRDWTTVTNGGYWAKGRRPLAMIRCRTRKALDRYKHVDMPKVFQAVNIAQRTAWQVNKKVLEVLNAIVDYKHPLAGLPSAEALELPIKSWAEGTEPDEAELKAWKKSASPVYRKNAARISRRISLSTTLDQANQFAEFEAIYFPHSLDWRGRLYAIPSFSPQGGDVAKGLLKFADSKAKPLGKDGAYWLAVHGANCMGFDKADLAERVAYVHKHEEMILSCAANPLEDTRWADQDSPFCFLAFCFEWAGYKSEGENYKCGIAVALDGTCSGLQHFSAMLRDEVGGAAVNLVAGLPRQDIYGIVAAKAEEIAKYDVISGSADKTEIKENKKSGEMSEKLVIGTKTLAAQWLTHGINRGVAKRSVMTLAYGSKKFGFGNQIMEDTIAPLVGSLNNPFTNGSQASMYMAGLIWDSVSTTVIAAVKAMEWLQAAAKLMASEVKEGEVVVKAALPITWVTPIGFPVWQEYNDYDKKRVRTLFNGDHNLAMTVAVKETPTINASKQAAGVAPNFVHSNDASHLKATVNHAHDTYGITELALIHDSFGAMPADTANLFKAVRESMVDMYEHNDVIADFRDQFDAQLHESQREKMPEVPTKGNLDLRGILNSEFAFS